MTEITIFSKEIRQIDGLYCLNDLHKASGGSEKHRPRQFLRTEQTKTLIEEIDQCADMRNEINTLHIENGGKNRGTYACKELVYAYAMWISPKFHLHVIRAFDAQQSQPALPPPSAPSVFQSGRYSFTVYDDGHFHASKLPAHVFLASIASLPEDIRNYATSDDISHLEEIIKVCAGMLSSLSMAAFEQLKAPDRQ